MIYNEVQVFNIKNAVVDKELVIIKWSSKQQFIRPVGAFSPDIYYVVEAGRRGDGNSRTESLLLGV